MVVNRFTHLSRTPSLDVDAISLSRHKQFFLEPFREFDAWGINGPQEDVCCPYNHYNSNESRKEESRLELPAFVGAGECIYPLHSL